MIPTASVIALHHYGFAVLDHFPASLQNRNGMPERRDRARDGVGWEIEAGYSRAARRGRRIAVSGTTATGPNGAALHPGDTYAQTKVALERALRAVEALGGGADDVLRSRLYLAPTANWSEAGRAHAELLGQVAPANTTLYVAGLIGKDFLVEVELEAELDQPA
jgi:enamine deaminase RidA (YjgF/YER057c/UK114 family)